jgi:hypothetical protein
VKPRVGAALALALCLAGLGAHTAAQAAVLKLQPGQTLAAVLAQAADGDEVQIPAGEYRGQVAVIQQHRLTLRGVGGRVVLQAAGAHAEGKAILVVRDGEVTIEDIEFRGARVPDRNGAGIRFERGRLTVRRCTFIDNENGILTGGDPEAELVVEGSRFADAPDSSKLPHLLYVGAIARFTLTGSHLSHGRHAHLVKSRARENLVRDNQLVDGEGGSAAYELEFPNGGIAQVVGNVIEQSADTTNAIVLAFGAEGRRDDRPHRLQVENNTFINRSRWPAIFVRVYERRLGGPVEKVMLNNTFTGLGVEIARRQIGTDTGGEMVR